MPRQFKLLSQHYINDILLEAGTIIGEGTEVPFTYPDGSPRPPSTEMEGLDEASQKEVEAVQARGWGINPAEYLPTTVDGTIPPPAADFAPPSVPSPAPPKVTVAPVRK